MKDFKIAEQKSQELLRTACHPQGYLASPVKHTNYQRIWARDGVICGLAGLLSGEHDLALGLKQTLISLAKHQNDLGHIPSNVGLSPEDPPPSFGGLCGRVDTIPWFIIGLGNYLHYYPDPAFAKAMRPSVDRALNLLRAWEFNDKGLLYVPQSGDWADEYILRGYILYDQLLRLWALDLYESMYDSTQWKEKASNLRALIKKNYFLRAESAEQSNLYHAHAYQLALKREGEQAYFWASFGPGGYQPGFDLWANALALFLGLYEPSEAKKLIAFTDKIQLELPLKLLPAYYPVIQAGDQEWENLLANHKYEFRNLPYEFHNGGTWAILNAFWGLGLWQMGEKAKAQEVLQQIHYLNYQGEKEGEEWGFYENFHTQKSSVSGTKYCTWSAAGAVILNKTQEGKSLYRGFFPRNEIRNDKK